MIINFISYDNMTQTIVLGITDPRSGFRRHKITRDVFKIYMELKSEDSLSETEKRIKQALIQKGGIKWLESEIQAHMRKALHGNENLILEK